MGLLRYWKFSTTLSSVSSMEMLGKGTVAPGLAGAGLQSFQCWWLNRTAVKPQQTWRQCTGDHSLRGPWVHNHQRRELQEWASGLLKVKEGSVTSILQVHALVQIFHCVADDTGEEKVEQHWNQDAPLLYAIGHVKSSWGGTVRQHLSCHVVVEQMDDLD